MAIPKLRLTILIKQSRWGFNSAEVYLNRADAKGNSGQYDDALVDYTKAIRIKLNFAEAYHNRGSLKRELEQYDAALADYTEAIRIKPNWAMAYYNRGIQKALCEELDAAIIDYNEAIRIEPDYAEAHANLGMAKIGLDRIDEAKSDLQTALELAEQQSSVDLKVFVENQLQQLNQLTSQQNNKKPRRGGQWKGKVKIAEDFDELPESFTEVFHGDKK